MSFKKIGMHSALKAVGTIGLFCCLYPLIAACMILSTDELKVLKSIILLLMNMIVGTFGFFLQKGLYCLQNTKNLNIVARKLIILAFIPPLVAKIFIFFPLEQTPSKIFLSAISVTAYLIGTWCYTAPYKDILSTNIISISVGLNLAVIFILWMLGKERNFSYSLSPFTVIFFMEILIFAVTRNQGNIDYLMERRQHNLSHLPKKIRYYNLSLLCVLAALTGLFYLFREQIIWIMKKILLGIRSGIILFIEFLRYLAELLSSDGELGEEAVQPQQGSGDMSAADNVSLGWIVILILIIVIIANRKSICNWLGRKLSRLAAIIKKFFLRSGSIKHYDDKSEYYYDKVYDIPLEQREKSRKASERASMRMLKKEYRTYQKMAVSEEKLRQGYKLLREWLLVSGVKIMPCDTTLEILQKQGEKLDHKALKIATICYNELEYGEKAFTDKAFFEVDNSVRLAFDS